MKSVERIRQGNGENSVDKKTPHEQLCDVFGQKLNLDPEASSLQPSGHPEEPDETCIMDGEIENNDERSGSLKPLRRNLAAFICENSTNG